MAASMKSGAQILRLKRMKKGENATTASVISARNSSILRRAHRQSGYKVTTVSSAIAVVSQTGCRVTTQSAAMIQVNSGALPMPFELIKPYAGHGADDDHG